MNLPAMQEIFRVALGESGVSKQGFGFGPLFRTMFGEIKSDDRKNSRIPVGHAPGLDDAFVRNELEMPANDAFSE